MVIPATMSLTKIQAGVHFERVYTLDVLEGDLTGRVYLVDIMRKSDRTIIKSLTTALNTTLRTLTITLTEANSTTLGTYLKTPLYWRCYYTYDSKKYPVWIGDVEIDDYRTLT